MIVLEDSKLHFSFPEITRQLSDLANAEASRLAGKFLAENRADAFRQLQEENHVFRGLSDEYKAEAAQILLALTPNSVLAAVKKSARSINFDSGSDRHPTTTVSFQRTLRIPDDGRTYPLPPGLGKFPLRHVDDFAGKIPQTWEKRGGVMMPIYQAEALWIYFHGSSNCAIKVGTGKINAVTGKVWAEGLRDDPQNYLPLPAQPWLDGYCVEKGFIRQFVAMPLGKDFSAEEQITGESTYGGIQLQMYPVKAAVQFKEIRKSFPHSLATILPFLLPEPPRPRRTALMTKASAAPVFAAAVHSSRTAMGLGPGGKMRQEIYEDERPLEDYDQNQTSRCFVHLCNSIDWKSITGALPPHRPISPQLYAENNLPWFDHYREDFDSLPGSKRLAELKTVADQYEDLEGDALPDNTPIAWGKVVSTGPKRSKTVSEWSETEEN